MIANFPKANGEQSLTEVFIQKLHVPHLVDTYKVSTQIVWLRKIKFAEAVILLYVDSS